MKVLRLLPRVAEMTKRGNLHKTFHTIPGIEKKSSVNVNCYNYILNGLKYSQSEPSLDLGLVSESPLSGNPSAGSALTPPWSQRIALCPLTHFFIRLHSHDYELWGPSEPLNPI